MIQVVLVGLIQVALAKRAPPPFVQPIRKGDRVYLAKTEPGGKGYVGVLAAEVEKDNRRLWTTEVFRGAYDPSLERDAQEVHFVKLEVRGKVLRARDERGRVYEVQLKDGQPVIGK